MFKKMIITPIVIATVFVGIYGWNKFATNVRALRDVANDQLDDAKGHAVRAAEIRVLLRDFNKSVEEYSARVADIDDQAKDAEAELAQLRADSQAKLAILRQAKVMLNDAAKVQFAIGGHPWNRREVSDDAVRRASEFQRLQATIAGREQALTQLRSGAGEAKVNLEKAKVAQSKLTDELAELETRLENAQMLAGVRQMMDKVGVPQFGPSSDLRTAMDRLRQQVRRAEVASKGTDAVRPSIAYEDHGKEAIDVLTTVIDKADADTEPKADPATEPAATR